MEISKSLLRVIPVLDTSEMGLESRVKEVRQGLRGTKFLLLHPVSYLSAGVTKSTFEQLEERLKGVRKGGGRIEDLSFKKFAMSCVESGEDFALEWVEIEGESVIQPGVSASAALLPMMKFNAEVIVRKRLGFYLRMFKPFESYVSEVQVHLVSRGSIRGVGRWVAGISVLFVAPLLSGVSFPQNMLPERQWDLIKEGGRSVYVEKAALEMAAEWRSWCQGK